VIKTSATVAEILVSDQGRATELQMKTMGNAYLDLVGSSMRRLAGERRRRRSSRRRRDKRFRDPEWNRTSFSIS